MAFLNWEDKYSVNLKEIDEQHKVWIGLINNLHDAMKVGKGKEALGSTFDEVVKYTKYHFDSEEKFFSMYSYPQSVSHKKVHEDFVVEVKKLKQDYDSGKTIMTLELMNKLKDWLTNHILVSDKEYTTYLNSKGVK